MKNIVIIICLFFALSINAQHATVNSSNGLSIRIQPSLKSERLGVIPYQGKVEVLESTKKFDLITLSKEKEVVGEWKKVSYKNLEGYVFDKFLTYDFNIYDIPYDRSSEDPKRSYVDVYTEKQFFENLGNMKTLNIKVKELDLVKYMDTHFNDFEKITNSKYLNTMGNDHQYFVYDDNTSALVLNNYSDLEIKSDCQTKIITYPIYMHNFNAVLFNNLTFKVNKDKIFNSYLFDLQSSKNVYFTNIEFAKDMIHIGRFSEVYMKHCDFIEDSELIVVLFSYLHIDSCKFFNSTEEKIYVDTNRNITDIAKVSVRNSYIGHNTKMKYFLKISGSFDMDEPKQYELKVDDTNIFEKNPNYKKLFIEVEFTG